LRTNTAAVPLSPSTSHWMLSRTWTGEVLRGGCRGRRV